MTAGAVQLVGLREQRRPPHGVAVPIACGAVFWTREYPPFAPFADFSQRKLLEHRFLLDCTRAAIRLMAATEGEA